MNWLRVALVMSASSAMNGDDDPFFIDRQIEAIGAELHLIRHSVIYSSNDRRAGSTSCFVGETAFKRLSHDEKGIFRVAPLRPSAGKAESETGCDGEEGANAPNRRDPFAATGAQGVNLLSDSMRIQRPSNFGADLNCRVDSAGANIVHADPCDPRRGPARRIPDEVGDDVGARHVPGSNSVSDGARDRRSLDSPSSRPRSAARFDREQVLEFDA